MEILAFCSSCCKGVDCELWFFFFFVSGASDKGLLIAPFNLRGGKWHKLSLFASTPGSPNGTDEWEFRVNLPPFGGSCSVSPDTGTV